MTDRERIEQALAAEAVKANRERLYAFSDAQIAAFEAMGIRMVPVNEKRIIAGVLEDAEAAGYAIYRPDDCATVFVDSCHHGHDDCQWLEIPAPHSDPGPHSLVPLGGDG